MLSLWRHALQFVKFKNNFSGPVPLITEALRGLCQLALASMVMGQFLRAVTACPPCPARQKDLESHFSPLLFAILFLLGAKSNCGATSRCHSEAWGCCQFQAHLCLQPLSLRGPKHPTLTLRGFPYMQHPSFHWAQEICWPLTHETVGKRYQPLGSLTAFPEMPWILIPFELYAIF